MGSRVSMADPRDSDGSDSDSDIEFILDPQGLSSVSSTSATATGATAAPQKTAEEAAEDAIIKQSGDAAAGPAAQPSETGAGAGSTATATTGPQKGTLDIDAVGEFEGKPIPAVVPGNLEEKPWRRPGTDLSDYFNYGFDEFTWMAYCNRQDKLRAHFTPQQLMMGMPPMPPMGNMPMPNGMPMPPFMMPPMMFPPQNQ